MNHELTAKWHELDKVRVGLKDVVVLRPDIRVADGYIQYSTDGGSTWTNIIAVADLKGADGAKGDTGAAGAPGKDGTNGKDGADGKPGAAGADGAKGADGITPHIGDNGNCYLGATDTGKPSRGATGAKGDTGPQGPKGDPGTPGAAGHTPVKGTDYWTAADKQEIVNNVLAALPDGTEVAY